MPLGTSFGRSMRTAWTAAACAVDAVIAVAVLDRAVGEPIDHH